MSIPLFHPERLGDTIEIMKVAKFGHCRLLIEEQNARFLTDPGGWINTYLGIKNLDAVLITHEHPDHLHAESLKAVLKTNPGAVILTNAGVGIRLDKLNITWQRISHGMETIIKTVKIQAYGEKHADVYDTVIPVDNTGYFVADKLFYPGDAFTDPGRSVDILALPVAGPWVRLRDSIEYGLKLKPRLAFPVHDFLIKEGTTDTHHRLPKAVLESKGTNFFVPEICKEYEI